MLLANGGIDKKPDGTSPKKSDKPENKGIYEPSAYCGPLTERILSALVQEQILPDDRSEVSESDAVSESVPDGEIREPSHEEVYTFEDRIRRELCFLGLITEKDAVEIAPDNTDDVSMELRRLQGLLRKVTDVNNARKSVVRELAVERMAYQEYNLILDEVNRQVEQSYQKRIVSCRISN